MSNEQFDISRRRFLRNAGIFSVAGALAACGVRPSEATDSKKEQETVSAFSDTDACACRP